MKHITANTKFALTGALLFAVFTVSAAPESISLYNHLTVGFDSAIIVHKNSEVSLIRDLPDTEQGNQFSVLRIGYQLHGGGNGVAGFGYKVNLGVSLGGSHLVSKGPKSPYLRNPEFDSYSYGFGRQIHVGQFFGASFRIIDSGSLLWFAAVGFSLDIMFGLPLTPVVNLFRFGMVFGPEVNSYFTYMFDSAFGISLGGNFTYYFTDLVWVFFGQRISGISGGFGVFFTFVVQ